jgi:hypothetical protein
MDTSSHCNFILACNIVTYSGMNFLLCSYYNSTLLWNPSVLGSEIVLAWFAPNGSDGDNERHKEVSRKCMWGSGIKVVMKLKKTLLEKLEPP